MRVLLLSRNRVVQELVKLGLKEIEGVELEILHSPEELRSDRYELMLVEDRELEAAAALEHLLVHKRVLLGRAEGALDRYDAVVSKPFLPADLSRIVEGVDPVAASQPPESGAGREAPETEVLDAEEILAIRRLLEEDGEGEGCETELSVEVESYSFEELLDLLDHHKTKKLKKLLRGAKIHITIEWPEEER